VAAAIVSAEAAAMRNHNVLIKRYVPEQIRANVANVHWPTSVFSLKTSKGPAAAASRCLLTTNVYKTRVVTQLLLSLLCLLQTCAGEPEWKRLQRRFTRAEIRCRTGKYPPKALARRRLTGGIKEPVSKNSPLYATWKGLKDRNDAHAAKHGAQPTPQLARAKKSDPDPRQNVLQVGLASRSLA